MAKKQEIIAKADEKIQSIIEAIKSFVVFEEQYRKYMCFRVWVNGKYNDIVKGEDWKDWAKELIDVDRLRAYAPHAARRVWKDAFDESRTQLENCLQKKDAEDAQEDTPPEVDPGGPGFDPTLGAIFDKRLERLLQKSDNPLVITPYDTRFQDAGTTGFVVDEKTIRDSEVENKDSILEATLARRKQLQKDPFYAGVASVINPYSLVKLYGSQGGQDLVDRRNQRRWYEVDQTEQGRQAYSLNPTTTSIIQWGEGDPYGRTPYHYSDFVFCKYWNIVPNNRMITLRRFPAPIVDNMKFPGMDGFNGAGTPTSKTDDNKSGDNNLAKTASVDSKGKGLGNETEDQGSGGKVDLPPMATAVTYFGEETNNSLSDILKFTTGLKWKDFESDVWETQTTSTPDMEAGPAGLFGNMTKYARMLNIATGNFDQNALLNEGMLPPDPYKDGPYENRIIGPVNAITSVKGRDRGILYENDITLNFEYVARPIGGVNTKAVLLDIISNFLIIGSASAMFWGGQHRHMGQPQTYPFMGGDKGIQQWYRGNPIGWGETAIDSFANKLVGGLELAKNFFGALLGGGGGKQGVNLKDILTGDNLAGNIIKATAAAKSKGGIPYLSGLKALLIGEPVGEWHLTIGNPLNPIAMIGNLICNSLEVEFGNELGPDDFPLEVKITANLQHGMARDRDAIQSMFNRGMGRIYDLPDGFTSSGDYETAVDNFTGNADSKQGRSPADWRLGTVIGGASTTGGKTGPSAVRENSMQGDQSVWNPIRFSAPSPNQQNLFFQNNSIQSRSEFRASTWISLKTTS